MKKYYIIKVSEDFLNSIISNAEVHDHEVGGHDYTDYITKVLRANGIHTKYNDLFGTKITKINTKYEEH